jgi:hypothetical protein
MTLRQAFAPEPRGIYLEEHQQLEVGFRPTSLRVLFGLCLTGVNPTSHEARMITRRALKQGEFHD